MIVRTRHESAFLARNMLGDPGERELFVYLPPGYEESDRRYATAYLLQVSDDGRQWSTIYSTTVSTCGTQTLSVTGTGRYLRVYGTKRATQFGYSLWEVVVHTGINP